MHKPKISIICATYNHERFVKYFIESILNQTEQDFELIIIDDNSTDNNVREINKFNDPRIKFIQHEFNQGINAALNTGFGQSVGKYIVFIASDDILEPSHLQVSSEYLDNNPDIDVFYTSLKLIDENNIPIKDEKNIYIRKNQDKYNLLRNSFFVGNSLLSPGMVIRKSALKKLMPLDLSIVQYQDYQMHIKLMLNGGIYISSQPLVNYRTTSQLDSISAQSSTTQLRESLEEDAFLDTFLEIKDIQTLKNIFGDNIEKVGEPIPEVIPYFLGMFAIFSRRRTRKNWGYRTIMKFIKTKENFDLLYNLYGFDFKKFINLVSSFNIE